MQLAYKTQGEGRPLIILHGLFGSSDNWQTLARELSVDYRVFLVDQRNHGRSPHAAPHTYSAMGEDLQAFIREHELQGCALMGHSMGGKTAMQAALDFPELIERFVVVDMAPRAYPGGHEPLFRAMMDLPVAQLESRQEAEEKLMKSVGNRAIVLFLMKNLKRKKAGGFSWKINLEVLFRDYPAILAPVEESGSPYSGPALFVSGARSDYIRPDDREEILRLFPEARFTEIADAGHWVHADQPDRLLAELRTFLPK